MKHFPLQVVPNWTTSLSNSFVRQKTVLFPVWSSTVLSALDTRNYSLYIQRREYIERRPESYFKTLKLLGNVWTYWIAFCIAKASSVHCLKMAFLFFLWNKFRALRNSIQIITFFFFLIVNVQLSPFPPTTTPPQPQPSLPSTLDPTLFDFVHVSFIHVPWQPFPLSSHDPLPPPLVSLFLISIKYNYFLKVLIFYTCVYVTHMLYYIY